MSLDVDWSASFHGVLRGVLIGGFIFDDAASPEGSDEPGPRSTAEFRIYETEDDFI